ncbi:MAG: hypothetical protein M1812_004154 [Candelaria pacifica]|nr:MAG: hypothetical protein M1812_004154 [Candelaria pacifica]
MAKQRSPDGRLVYLHCASIFSGANGQVRRLKKISQLLERHKTSIKILTKEFTLPAIAAIAKELLDEQIFQSLPRAKLRYPELFQLTETQEAERAASEAEVVRIEAEAAQDTVLTSDDEGGAECLDLKRSRQRAEPEETVEVETETREDGRISANELWHVFKPSTTQGHQVLSVPRLHPVYLPFRSQHRTLVLVQSLLEESCFEFGNAWVPDLMEARKWHEAESIELTEWTKSFSKYAKSLPPSAIKPIAGKSIAEVLFGTSALRHSAVHRLPTSVAGILKMLHAANFFAEALNDSKRAEKLVEIRIQLEASVEEILQHQYLLERKLRDQLEDIARRRAELDELERLSIEEMLATDKKQRTEVGSAFESFLIGSQQTSTPDACSHTLSFDGTKADSKAKEHTEISGIEPEQKPANKAQACDQSPLGEEKSYQGEELEEDTRPLRHDNNGGGSAEEPAVSEMTLLPLRSKDRMKKRKNAAAFDWGIPIAEEAPVLIDEASTSGEASPALTQNMGSTWPRYGAWKLDATTDVYEEPRTAADEAIQAEEPYYAASERISHIDEPYDIAPKEEPIPEDTIPVRKAVSNEDSIGTEKVAPHVTVEGSQTEVIIEDFDDAEEHSLNQHDDIPCESDDPYELTTGLDVAPMHNASAEDAEILEPPPRPALSAVRGDLDFHAPSSTVTSVLEAAAPEAPTEDRHTITLKILNDSKVLRSIVSIRACTRTAIFNEARAYCARYAQDDQCLETLLAKEHDLALVSLNMHGYDMDLSMYKVEDLSSLFRAVEKTSIPRFTLRIYEL